MLVKTSLSSDTSMPCAGDIALRLIEARGQCKRMWSMLGALIAPNEIQIVTFRHGLWTCTSPLRVGKSKRTSADALQALWVVLGGAAEPHLLKEGWELATGVLHVKRNDDSPEDAFFVRRGESVLCALTCAGSDASGCGGTWVAKLGSTDFAEGVVRTERDCLRDLGADPRCRDVVPAVLPDAAYPLPSGEEAVITRFIQPDACNGQPLTADQCACVLRALGVANRRGWCHRDVAARNIVCSSPSTAVLIDWGTACRADCAVEYYGSCETASLRVLGELSKVGCDTLKHSLADDIESLVLTIMLAESDELHRDIVGVVTRGRPVFQWANETRGRWERRWSRSWAARAIFKAALHCIETLVLDSAGDDRQEVDRKVLLREAGRLCCQTASQCVALITDDGSRANMPRVGVVLDAAGAH